MSYPPTLDAAALAGATVYAPCPTCGAPVAAVDAKKQGDLTVALKAHWDRRQQAWDAANAAVAKDLTTAQRTTLQSDLATLANAVKAIAPTVDPLAL